MKVYSITDLVRCPRFTPYSWFKELGEYGKYAHDKIVEELRKRFPEGEAEKEVAYQFSVDNELVEVRGRIDYIRYDEPIFYEIKPLPRSKLKVPIEYMLQIWFYELALRTITRRWYVGYIVFYDRKTLRYKILKPIYHNDNYEDHIIGLIKFKIKNENETIRGGLCRFCVLNDACKARYVFDKYRGVRRIV